MTLRRSHVAGYWKRLRFRALIGLYPPYLGAGVRLKHLADDFSAIEVEMPLRFWNRNYVGTHFGGSLYSMTDPFLMLMLIEQLGPGYVVWDKSASIRFRRPGRGTVRARFEIPAARVQEIRSAADSGETVEPAFTVKVVDEQGEVVAVVQKVLHVRTKS
jgi:acyl-coenzyme A thioesterase PaaI-like protein